MQMPAIDGSQAATGGKHRFVYCEFRLFRIEWPLRTRVPVNKEPTMSVNETFSLPSKKAMEAAVSSQRELAAFISTKAETQRIQVIDENNEPHQIDIPTSAIRLLVDILAELGEGNAVKVIPIHAELTTQEAADLLNVSRPHVVKLLETNALKGHKTGKHRRILFADLMEYKNKRLAESEAAMDELTQQAQQLKMGYE
jgi:excisionase family DNA binding protein